MSEDALAAEASEAALTRAQLFQSLLSQPTKVPQPKVQRRAISQWERVQRWIVAIVLLVPAMLLIWQQLGYQFGLPDPPVLAQPSASTEARALYEVIEGSDAQSRVLIAFEYGAAEADELNLIAEPLLQHLVERGAIISAVSTQPEGIAVANALQNGIGPEGTFTDSRYLPGNDTGIAQQLRDLETNNARPSAIIVLAARPAPLRWWVEQTQAVYWNAAPTVVAGVSAAVEPVAIPYADGDPAQLSAVVSGLRGAAAYEIERGGGGQITQQYNALAAGHVVVICLIVLGGILYAVEGSLRRSK
jgi:hypothetical protein